MKYFKDFKKVIAVKEQSAGNDTVGDMWLETKSFDPDTPVKDIIEWARNCGGLLILSIDETGADNNSKLNF